MHAHVWALVTIKVSLNSKACKRGREGMCEWACVDVDVCISASACTRVRSDQHLSAHMPARKGQSTHSCVYVCIYVHISASVHTTVYSNSMCIFVQQAGL